MKMLINVAGDRGRRRAARDGRRAPRAGGGCREPGDRAAGRAGGREGGAGLRRRLAGTSRCTAGSSGPACCRRRLSRRGLHLARCPTRWCGPPRPWTAAQGVLFIVKNYTGDVLNFDMAAELAEDEGVQVAKVLVNDDVAVTDRLYTAGRRGTGATLFVEKIAGAAAEEGMPLERVEALARQVNGVVAQLRRRAERLSPPRPRAARPSICPAGELELGVGIHGEPGRERRAMMTSREIADFAVDAILEDLDPDGSGAGAGQRHGRHPAAGAVRIQRGGAAGARRAGRGGGPYARRQLRDLAGHGGLLGDAVPGRRGAAAAVGRAGGDSRPALGR